MNCYLTKLKIRNSQWGSSVGKGVLRNFAKSHENTCARCFFPFCDSFFIWQSKAFFFSLFCYLVFGTKYSRMKQIKLVEDRL